MTERFKMAVPDEKITNEHLECAQTAMELAMVKWVKAGEPGDSVMNFVMLEMARVIATICEAANIDFKGVLHMPAPGDN